jgi:hypothetical protein
MPETPVVLLITRLPKSEAGSENGSGLLHVVWTQRHLVAVVAAC